MLSTGLTVFGAEQGKQPHVKDNYAQSGTSGRVTNLNRMTGTQETRKKLGSEMRTRTRWPLKAKKKWLVLSYLDPQGRAQKNQHESSLKVEARTRWQRMRK